MKKCASCSKDLPEAALHCVFCGAKQAPAPAVQSAHAKTAFGYSANEVMQQLGSRTPQQQPQQVSPQPSGLVPGNAATMLAPPVNAPQAQQGYGQQPGGYQQPPAQGYGQPQAGYQQPSGGYNQAPGNNQSPQGYGAPSGPAPLGIHSPPQPTPAPLPAVKQPYRAAQTSAGRPIEPWKDALKLMMIVWGVIAVAAFATPILTEPLTFRWDQILDGEGKAKIPPLVWGAVGLLSIVFAVIPMATAPRGALAAVLGLAGALVPILIMGELPPWQLLLLFFAPLLLVPGLLVRHEYVESTLARVLVTLGVIGVLLPFVVPDGGEIPLVNLFKRLIEAGSGMEVVIVGLAQVVLAVVCLMVWMPGPATAGAKIFAWAWILLPIAAYVLYATGSADIGEVVSKQPGMLLDWVGSPSVAGAGVAYTVLAGYGLATVIGKQLE